MAYETIIVDRNPGWLKITLNRPQAMNALNSKLRQELMQACTEAESDNTIKVIVITGQGKAFSAGADLKELSQYKDIYSYEMENTRAFHNTFNFIQHLAKPVIAVISGYCLAGGLELAVSCDILIAADDAKIGDQHANFALLPGGGNSQRLPRLIGLRKALELMLTGAWLSGKEAAEIGLVNKSVPADKLEEATMEYVNMLVDKSPLTLARIKKLAWATLETSLSVGNELEILTSCTHQASEDVKEGLAAFLEKREPHYTGR